MKAERIENNCDDLMVVNAARVSFDKESDYVVHCNADCYEHGWMPDEDCPNCEVDLKPEDKKLIKYLAKHEHWTPFAHNIYTFKHVAKTEDLLKYVLETHGPGVKFYTEKPTSNMGNLMVLYESASLYHLLNRESLHETMWVHAIEKSPTSFTNLLEYSNIEIRKTDRRIWNITPIHLKHIPAPLQWVTFRLKMPIFVAREWFRHTKGFVRNEVSRRYVDSLPDLFLPTSYRQKAETRKQGSESTPPKKNKELIKATELMNNMSLVFYNTLIKEGVAPEMARASLPQSMYTEFIETGYIDDYKRLFSLRIQPDAQLEIQEMAKLVQEAFYL